MNTAHRTWPPPARTWVLAQVWCDLLFAHWPLPADVLRPLLPDGVTLDTRDGEAWIAVVPFRMEGIRPRGLMSVPRLSDTAELNVRTYVTAGGVPGVYFFSLDAANPVAVRIARRFFHLPYYRAQMAVRREGDAIRYESARVAAPEVQLRSMYEPCGGVFRAAPGTLEHWLTERYCFYTHDRAGTVVRGDIHHEPWPLQPAQADITSNGMTLPLGITLPKTVPLLHFARRIEVVCWLPQRVAS